MKFQKKDIIVCGTDTDVGKTVISSLLVQGLNGSYWKPIQSGAIDQTDTEFVRTTLSLPNERWIPEIYKFDAPVSPHWAAEKENTKVDISKLKVPKVEGPLIIEMAGGLMVPLNRNHLQIDVISDWELPVVIVARSGLGTINHTLLTLEALHHRKILCLGVVLNGPIHPDNPKTLAEIGGCPILAQIPYLSTLNKETLDNEWSNQCIGLNLEKAFS